jgi:outer membrane protein
MQTLRVLAIATFATAALNLADMGQTAAAQTAGKEMLIGYVDIQRAIVEVDEGKRAKEALKATFEKKQKALSEKEAELKKLKDAIDKESIVKDDDATRARKAEFQTKLMELQQVFMKEQKDLQEAEGKQLSAITEKMRKVIVEIGDQGGYTLILESSGTRMLFAKPHLDLTNEVIRKYNSRHK